MNIDITTGPVSVAHADLADTRAVPTLPLETTYRRLPAVMFADVAPTPVREPGVVLFNAALAAELGLGDLDPRAPGTAAILAGDAVVPDTMPFAQAYAGHQFGHLAMLGDGRALVLGEVVTPDGRRFDLQLKGSGPTPYSRRGDGRAALGPMLREFIVSEAMQALGIPTTRSLAVATTGETVFRDAPLPGAVLTRVAASHIRVGTFQFAALQQDRAVLAALVEYTIARHDPALAEADNRALALLDAVVERQAALVVEWLRVGFIHGVMNTDNMAISGETIDYGPCAFMDTYDPARVFSSIDRQGRYAFMNQPRIAQWNLARLAEALLPMIDPDEAKAVEKATRSVERFMPLLEAGWLAMMRMKLGLAGEHADDPALISDLLAWMHANEADYTNTFRDLMRDDATIAETVPATLRPWLARWGARRALAGGSPEASRRAMAAANPAVIPRNHKVEEALDAATANGDLAPLHALLEALARPYDDRPDLAPYREPPGPGERVYQTFCGT